MASESGFSRWIIHDTNWSRAGVPMAAVLIALSPLLRRRLGKDAFSIFLQLPIYMIHQYEEHGHGAFKEYANRTMLQGRGQATDGNIFVINVGGVWGVDLAALYLACYRRPASGLLAPYLPLVNGLLHVVPVLRTRHYNPGAWTGGLLLLPAGLYSAVTITRSGSASVRDHARALAGAALVHLMVMAILLTARPEPRSGD